MKRVFALLLALMLVMSLATTAFAATTNLTVDQTGYTARTFNAYMVLSATNNDANTEAFDYKVIPAYRNALVAALGIVTTDSTGAAKTEEVIDAEILAAIAALSTEGTRHFANDLYRAILADTTITTPDISNWNGSERTVDQGYWLIADVTDLDGVENENNSLVMLDTAGDADLTVTLKTDKTNTEKKIDDENDSIVADEPGNEDATVWQDTADYDIGDEVPFRITGKVANNVVSYDYYSFRLVDVLSKGLTLNVDSLQMKVRDYGPVAVVAAAAADADDPWVYTVSTDPATKETTLTVYPNKDYVDHDNNPVTASAENGGDFKQLFPAGTSHDLINSATYTLTYTCTLNSDAEIGSTGNKNDAKVIVSNNPYDDSFGTTPLDTTITFTYAFEVNKTDPTGKPLAGAEFNLYKFIAEGAGEKTGDDVYATAEDAIKNNGYFNHPAAECYGKFAVVNRLVVSDDQTQFTFRGIDDGYYALVETTAPEGYKAIEPVEFHVVATHVTDLNGHSGAVLTKLEAIVKGSGQNLVIDGNETTGVMSTIVENSAGSELPSTGGMGTTLFYVLGGLMVAGSLVLLITKRRMSVN